MVGEAVYGRGKVGRTKVGRTKVGRTKVGRTNDDRGKDVVPHVILFLGNFYFKIPSQYFMSKTHIQPITHPYFFQNPGCHL